MSLSALVALPFALLAANPSATQLSEAEIRSLVAGSETTAIDLFREFLALPNDAHYPTDIDRLVDWMEPQFARRGFTTRRIETPGNDALYAEWLTKTDAPTVLVYLQADGQPVDPAAWDQESPWQPVLKEQRDGGWHTIPWSKVSDGPDPDWRIFARSAADSKGPMTQFLVACDLLRQAGVEPAFNLKVIIDTEEEMGSPHLPGFVTANRDLMAADMLLIFDGPPHASNAPTVTFGARGMMALTLTTYGPIVPQHSGHYGNFVPNPAFHLAHILASMKSPDGRVQIAGFYDGIELTDEVRNQLAAVPDDEAAILAGMGLLESDRVAPSLQEALQYPSLNIRGMGAAWIGDEVRTIIPATATAEIDIRLVLESDAEHLVARVRDHIADLGYTVLDGAPTAAERQQHARLVSLTHHRSYGAFRSDFDSAPGLLARAALRHLYGAEPILIRSLGGSIPIAPFVEILGVPAATVPTVNIDNNQHSPNENIRVGNFIEGIAILLAVLATHPPEPLP